jgi:hypothetical protein
VTDSIVLIKLALFVLPGLLLLAAGLFLLKRGLWPARQGTDPHCRHCEYNLTGLPTGLCPECGTAWTPETAATGHRQRRSGLGLVGGLLLAAACLWLLAPLADRFVSFNYLALLPTRVVLMCVDDSGTGQGQRAVDEMAARLTAGTVPANLAEQFFRRIVSFDLKVRPQAIHGDNVPFRIGLSGPRIAGVMLHMDYYQVLLDGTSVREQVGHSMRASLRDGRNGSAFGSSLQCPSVGKHLFELVPRVRYSWTCPGNVQGSCTYTVPLKAEVQVLPADSPDTVLVVHDPNLKDDLQRRIKPTQCELSGSGRNRRINLTFNVDNSPVGLGFEVFVRAAGTEYPMSQFSTPKGKLHGCSFGGFYQGPAAPMVDIILRSSAKAARGTVDLNEVWEGELVFPDVPLTTQGATPAAASQPMGQAASS